jgi:hypothetical protein
VCDCAFIQLPDYRDIVKHPMDFSTLRKKLDKGAYANLEQFEVSVESVCWCSLLSVLFLVILGFHIYQGKKLRAFIGICGEFGYLSCYINWITDQLHDASVFFRADISPSFLHRDIFLLDSCTTVVNN